MQAVTACPSEPQDPASIGSVLAVLGSTEADWKELFARAGKVYRPPNLVMFSGATQSACGFAQCALGPFYCPNDQKVYLDAGKRFFRGSAPQAGWPSAKR